MHAKPRNRARGLMDSKTLVRAIKWVEKIGATDPLALHVFGEPLIHPDFHTISLMFSKLANVTMSTNAVLLDEKWADKLALVPWAWISLSNWKPESVEKAANLLVPRGIKVLFPPGVTHDWAGQSEGPKKKLFKGCHFLREGTGVIRWNGDIASCCITDREQDVIGHVDLEPEEVTMRDYDLCGSCHHAV